MIPMNDNPKTDLDNEVNALLDTVEKGEAGADPVEAEEEPMGKSEMDLRVAAVIPLHEIPGTTLKRRPGRPKKIAPQPSASDLVYHAEMAKQQTNYVESDAIVRATKDRKDSMEVLNLTKERYARILAALEFRRIEDEKTGGKNSAQILSREAAVLRDIATLEMRISEMGVQTLDLRGEQMQKVFGVFVTKIREVAKEVLPKEQFDLFFNRCETALEGWEDEADSLLR
jgi:hypothetical protein